MSDTQYAHDNDNIIIDPPILTPFDEDGLAPAMYEQFNRDELHQRLNHLLNNLNL